MTPTQRIIANAILIREQSRVNPRDLIVHLDEAALRSLLIQAIDDYYWSEQQINEKLRKTGDELREETALHIAGLMAGIDTDPEGDGK